MEIPVVVEPDTTNGFRAKTGAPLGLSANGPSRSEALKNLEELVQKKLSNGIELTALRVRATDENNPWVKFAGMFKDDPMFDGWQRAIKEYRREVEEDSEYL